MQLQENQEIRQKKEQSDIGKNFISYFSKEVKSDVSNLKFNLPTWNLTADIKLSNERT